MESLQGINFIVKPRRNYSRAVIPIVNTLLLSVLLIPQLNNLVSGGLKTYQLFDQVDAWVNPGSVPQLDSEQHKIVNQIIQAGKSSRVSDRDIQIGIMVGMQESGLKNLDHGDDWFFAANSAVLGSAKSDSIGVFQQRDMPPWNKRDRMNPYEAALSFFEQLKHVQDRDNMEMWQVAAKVQRPAKEYEQHYDQWKNLAQQVVSAKVEKPSIFGLPFSGFQDVRGEQGWDQKTFLSPVNAPITSGFGMRLHPIKGTLQPHNGIDFGADTGTPIRASIPGKVLIANDENDGFGNKIVIENGEYRTIYAHLQDLSVTPGSTVNAGEVIGTVGSTGLSTAPHLHFEIHYQGQPIDPVSKLTARL